MDQIWSEREERRGTFGLTKWGSNHPPRVVRLTSTVGHHPFAQGAVSSPIVVKLLMLNAVPFNTNARLTCALQVLAGRISRLPDVLERK